MHPLRPLHRIRGAFIILAPALVLPSTALIAQQNGEDLLRGTLNGSWRSTYEAPSSPPTLIRNATVMTAAGEELVGDPLEFSEYPEHVFIRGLEVDTDSRHRRLQERYRVLDGETGYRR